MRTNTPKSILQTCLLAVAITFSNLVSAQEAQIDGRLHSRFSVEELNEMSSAELEYWNYIAGNSFYVTTIPQEKAADLASFPVISAPTEATQINIFELGLEPNENTPQYFRIENTNQALIIKAQTDIDEFAPSVLTETSVASIPNALPMGGGTPPDSIFINSGGTFPIDCGTGTNLEYTLVDDNPDTSLAYPANSNFVVTVCPDGNSGSTMTFSIDTSLHTWDVHSSDVLNVYDGSSTSAPLLGSFNSSTDTAGIFVEATLDNSSGCLTFEFISDGSMEGAGFTGTLSCYYPCQPFTASISSVPLMVPQIQDSGYIDICLGDSVVFTGTGDYPYSGLLGGIGYDQFDGNSTFNWIISDGTTIDDTSSFTFHPSQRAGYFIDLQIVDTLGCVDFVRTKVRVSTIPSFTELATVLDDTICPGENSVIIGGFDANGEAIGHEPTQGSFVSGGIFGAQTFLPDGNNNNYTTDIEITQFAQGQLVENASDVMEVCLTMEHSYLGDLEMTLTCPDGTTVNMFNSYNGAAVGQLVPGGFGGGGVFLGDALDDGSNDPGVGWEYCFSESALWGTMEQEFDDGNFEIAPIEGSNSMAEGTYQPEETYASFIGCPINGTWTITVRDNLTIDNGYIFEWGILFNPDINPNSEFYTPEISTGFWSPDPIITEFLADSAILVTPPAPGDYDFTYNVEDNYGCAYDTTVLVHMVPPITSFTDTSICAEEIEISAADLPIVGEWSVSSIVGTASFSPDEFSSDANVSVTDYGRYTFVFEAEYCGQVDSVRVRFDPTPANVSLVDQTVCPGTTLSFDAENEDIGATYEWLPGGSTDQTFTLDSLTSTTGIQVTVTNLCGTANGAATIEVESLDVAGPIEVCLDDQADLVANVTTSGGTWESFGPTAATFSPSETSANPTVTTTIEGAYNFVYTDDDCGMKDSVEVYFTPTPTIEITTDTLRICLEDEIVLRYNINTDIYDMVGWTPYSDVMDDSLVISGEDITAQSALDSLFYVSASISNFCGSAEDEIVYEVIDCTLDVPNVFNPGSSIPENQYFNLVALDLHPGNIVKIFDRWGRKVYDVVDYHLNPWNGGKESDGVYYYILEREGYEAEKGYVHLVRGGS